MIKRSSGIAASSYTSNHCIWILTSCVLQKLRLYFFTDNGLKAGNHIWIRMGTDHRSDQIISLFWVSYPIANRFVGCIFEGSTSTFSRHDRRAQHFHTSHIGSLALDIYFSHKNNALQIHQSTNRRSSNTVLSSPCLCYDAFLTQMLGKQNLPNGIVYFVRTCVAQIFSLQVDRSLEFLRQMFGQIKWCRPSDIFVQQVLVFFLKSVGIDNLQVIILQLFDIGMQQFWNKSPSELSVIPFFCRLKFCFHSGCF